MDTLIVRCLYSRYFYSFTSFNNITRARSVWQRFPSETRRASFSRRTRDSLFCVSRRAPALRISLITKKLPGAVIRVCSIDVCVFFPSLRVFSLVTANVEFRSYCYSLSQPRGSPGTSRINIYHSRSLDQTRPYQSDFITSGRSSITR